jgi:hypothetical protein
LLLQLRRSGKGLAATHLPEIIVRLVLDPNPAKVCTAPVAPAITGDILFPA